MTQHEHPLVLSRTLLVVLTLILILLRVHTVS